MKPSQESKAHKLGHAVGQSFRGTKSTVKEVAALTKTQTGEVKIGARLAKESLGQRRNKASQYLTNVVGRALLGNITIPSSEVAAGVERAKVSQKRKLTFDNPLSKLIETAKQHKPSSRTMGRLAMASLMVTTAVLAKETPTSVQSADWALEQLANPQLPGVSKDKATTVISARPTANGNSLPGNWVAPTTRPTSVMDSNITSTWSAPRAEERVVYNALPVPSINAVDYATNQAAQAKAEAMQQQYRAYELARAQNRTSVPAPTTMLDTYVGWGEQTEIKRLAAQAEAAAEMQHIAAEREAAVAQIEPGQVMATLTMTQTGEAEGAPAGPYTNFHGVRAGMPELAPNTAATAYDFDLGLDSILGSGFGMYLSTQVPSLDTGKETVNADRPIVILGHNQTPIEDPLNPQSSEAFRYPDKTKFRNEETGERGDIWTLTMDDGTIRQYEAVTSAVVDINDPEVSKVIFESPFGGNGMNAYWCEHINDSTGETPYRGVMYFEDVTNQAIRDTSALSAHSQS